MQDTLVSLDRFEDSGDILSTINRGIRDATQADGQRSTCSSPAARVSARAR